MAATSNRPFLASLLAPLLKYHQKKRNEMKPQLKGDLPALYAARATKIRKTKTFDGVEYIYRRDLTAWGYGVDYLICCAGVNANGVAIAAYFEPGDTAYFWQIADRVAVADIMQHPENAYNWYCVKNGIRR